VLASAAKVALDVTGDEAIRWVRQHIRGAVETRSQEKVVGDFTPSP